ncbi:hypothetical protein Taro_007404, partial [Colocasia esculenta]|nr:hypothetical protein [Colocasia esculenta]
MSASLEHFSGRRGKRCWIAALSPGSLGCRGVGRLVRSHCLALHGSGAVSGGQTWDRSPARLRLVVVVVHASHSEGRGDLDLWSSGKTPLCCSCFRCRTGEGPGSLLGFVREAHPPLLPSRFELEGAGARVRTVCVVPLVVSSISN